MDGFLNVLKTAGPTSHDVVNQVRRLFAQKRVGHAGTLDPMATGVLVVALGKATRVLEYLEVEPKRYTARMIMGAATDTEDSTGSVTSEADASSVTRQDFESVAATFVGETEQIPPMVSAVKHQGKRLYQLARRGETVERHPRQIKVWSIGVIGFTPGPRADAEIEVECSGGTYIRTLCADIGARLGCGAHMSSLDRTRVGRFSIDDGRTIEALSEMKLRGELESALEDASTTLSNLPEVRLCERDVRDLLHGIPVDVGANVPPGDTVRLTTPEGVLAAVGVVDQEGARRLARPRKVLLDTSVEASR